MATSSALMTVEQFRALPEPQGGYYELHHGVPVFMTRPKHKHWLIQQRLIELLKAANSGSGIIGTEFAFRPAPEHELWCADVAYVSAARAGEIDPEDNLCCAPDLVIEVLSPSNTMTELNEREAMCLESGCREFWIVDPKRKTVKVSTPDRKTITYLESERIPLHVLGGGDLPVSDIFA